MNKALLKSRRLKQSISQAGLAMLAGLSQSEVSRAEGAKGPRPSPQRLSRIDRALTILERMRGKDERLRELGRAVMEKEQTC